MGIKILGDIDVAEIQQRTPLTPEQTFRKLWRCGGPMRAMNYGQQREAILGSTWVMQEKLRGIRGVLYGDRMYSKLGNEFIHMRGKFNSKNYILEGEIYYEEMSQEEHQSAVHGGVGHDLLSFFIFDIVDFDRSYVDRWQLLQKIQTEIEGDTYVLGVAPPEEYDYQYIIRNGGEGVVYKHKYAKYNCGPQPTVIKRKEVQDAEAVVIGVNEEVSIEGVPKGRCGSLQCLTLEGKHFVDIGGLTDELKAYFWSFPPNGTTINFKYDHLSDKGVPVNPRFNYVRREDT